MTESARWFTGEYLRIVTAHYDPNSHTITVTFGDGDHASIVVTQVVQRKPLELDWPHMTVEDSFYLHIPALPSAGRDAADIPAFDIRAVSDAEFAAHLQRSATAAAQRVGARIRTLRESRGLSIEETATRAGVAEHVLRRIEQGKHRGEVSMTEKILTAIGYALEDILPEEQAALVK